MSVSLRPARRSDLAWLDTWLTAVATSVGLAVGDAATLLADRGRIVSVVMRDGAPAGLIVHRRARASSAIIELVGTPPSEARRGTGMQAATRLEAALRGRGVRAIFAPAPEVHGIAMYFWIRLGYRPLLKAEFPAICEGVAWLRRDIAREGSRARRMVASRGSR